MYRKRSIILTKPTNDPRKMPRFMEAYDFSRKGLEQMLEDRLNKQTGSLQEYRAVVKQHLEAWRLYIGRQVKGLRPPAEPVGSFAENINRARAKVIVTEEECRELQRLLRLDAEGAALAKTLRGRVANKPRGMMKFKAGELLNVDGREIQSREDGELISADDGSPVEEYLEALRKTERARTSAKQAKQRAMAEGIRKIRRGDVVQECGTVIKE
jgi:hypothetical protein